jgi:hypothetical protein
MQGLRPNPLLPEHILKFWVKTKFSKELAEAEWRFKQCGKLTL